MTNKAPSKPQRLGLTFRNEETAKTWLAEQRWRHGPALRYVGEFTDRHNIRDQMQAVVVGMEWKRLRYRELMT